MNRFTDAGLVENQIWDMRLDDWKAGKNRQLIDRVFNGAPPWDEKEADLHGVRTNLNDLSGARYMADARRSLQRALKTSDSFFKVAVDYGPAHKRADWSATITAKINKAMKRSRVYSETLESQIALKCVHGIGPVHWIDRDRWDPIAIAIQDVLIPARTLRDMENLDRFAVFRQLTGEQLYRMTHGTAVDPAWQMDVVDSALKWVYDQSTGQQNQWANWYAPQNIEEVLKEDQGYFGSSAVPTIDIWDWYYHSDEHGKEGWRRGMLLDTPYRGELKNQPGPDKNGYDMDHGRWLYQPNAKRVYASKLDELLHFQFGDATSTAPFRYHGVRSLGWLLYPFCHLQNRLYSKFIDHLFENLLQYIRADRQEDYEAFVKAELHDYGCVPTNIQFVKQDERWQINQQLVELGFMQNRSHMDEAAAQYREGRETQKPSERETATAVIARVNAAAALVGSLITTTYEEMGFQYLEICRRFCNKASQNHAVRKFRAAVLEAGVPPEALNSECWDVTPDKILGNGNKMMAMAMVQSLMESYPLFSPQAQKEVLHLKVLNTTDDPGMANRIAPVADEDTTVAVRKAQNLIGSLMQGIPAVPTRDDVPITMAETLLHSMASIVNRMAATGPTPQDMAGMQAFAQTIGAYIQIIAGDKDQAPKAKELGQDLGNLMKVVGQMGKALAQKAQQGNGAQGPDPTQIVKAQSMAQQAKIKQDAAQKSHAQRTAQKQVSFELQQQQDMERHRMDMMKEGQKLRLKAAGDAMQLANESKRQSIKGLEE